MSQCTLTNYLGTGKNPRIHLELGANGPGVPQGKKIDYRGTGKIPGSANPSEQWVAWNVKDEKENYYGTIDLQNCDGNQAQWKDYKPGSGGYYLESIHYEPVPGKSHAYQLTVDKIHRPTEVSGPPVITNDGWTSGMGNTHSKPTAGANFWVQDYGMDEPGRWTVVDQAISQSTAKIGNNVGSRAFPVHLKTASPWTYSEGPGCAFEGLWQIDIKIGSKGYGDFCETFYLAERANLTQGPDNYTDGSGGNHTPPRYSREIDIMETRWGGGDGPWINLPNGGNTSWNPSFGGRKKGKWKDVGGAPTPGFVTLGALIRGDSLWIYAYKTDGTQWYCTDAIPRVSNYEQKHSFVPYIGTWANQGTPPGDFSTEYKNYVYLSQNDPKIANYNPKDNPDKFGHCLT